MLEYAMELDREELDFTLARPRVLMTYSREFTRLLTNLLKFSFVVSEMLV